MWDDLGCIIIILLVIFLCFGVTIGGTHYGCGGCDNEKGIQIEMREETPRGTPQSQQVNPPQQIQFHAVDFEDEEVVQVQR